MQWRSATTDADLMRGTDDDEISYATGWTISGLRRWAPSWRSGCWEFDLSFSLHDPLAAGHAQSCAASDRQVEHDALGIGASGENLKSIGALTSCA